MGSREQYELAAKAAGITIRGWSFSSKICSGKEEVPFIDGTQGKSSKRFWNPKYSDCDAFRLAVKLGFVVYTEIPSDSEIKDERHAVRMSIFNMAVEKGEQDDAEMRELPIP